jgi:hypothetical protein
MHFRMKNVDGMLVALAWQSFSSSRKKGAMNTSFHTGHTRPTHRCDPATVSPFLMSLISFSRGRNILKFCPTVYDLFAVFQFPVYSLLPPLFTFSPQCTSHQGGWEGGISVAIRSTALYLPQWSPYRFTLLCAYRYRSAFACYMNVVKRGTISLTATREAFLA